MIKKNRQAVALHYDGKKAPRVTAKGEGEIAERIIQIAKQHGIPLQENKELTALLAQVQLNGEIPPKLYVAVAQMLAFLYFLNGKTPKDYHP
ncbi:flagellar protein FlhB [Legionella birminghamensis]|uniref:Flagellar biosynthetic protein FlhB n=1 Tax=Legionella birminghamensis TaxID=28083 RepID=A0A378IEI1_9GAMM|nr:EscU/YscU/HrcU family type III secretion system export apparatus switch protein [Legionella birminghamensis]KTC72521.1 flagellar protein FlhB [Legionella birminghamensis]STX30654.1 flagellar biosynthesis protein [Legionella birminghamensis]